MAAGTRLKQKVTDQIYIYIYIYIYMPIAKIRYIRIMLFIDMFYAGLFDKKLNIQYCRIKKFILCLLH